jgi:hypothetical protein
LAGILTIGNEMDSCLKAAYKGDKQSIEQSYNLSIAYIIDPSFFWYYHLVPIKHLTYNKAKIITKRQGFHKVWTTMKHGPYHKPFFTLR